MKKILNEPNHECVCPVCGKTFIVTPYHAYKRFGKLVCSWDCFLKSASPRKVNEIEEVKVTAGKEAKIPEVEIIPTVKEIKPKTPSNSYHAQYYQKHKEELARKRALKKAESRK